MLATRTAAGFVAAALSTGCATSLSVSAAPTLDTKGRAGTEERLELTAAAGSTTARLYGGVAVGAGYLGAAGSGYATVSPEAGVEGGQSIRWSAGAMYAPKALFAGPDKVAHGVGVAGQALFHVARMGGEDGRLVLGPRLSAEANFGVGDPAADGTRAIGLFQLGLVVRWVTFDTTAKSW
jgi:hypothetical protein